MWIRFVVAFGLVLCCTPGSAGAAELPGKPLVTTIAGSGVSGLRDGPAASAEFVDPVALAYGPDGSLFIADAGAQRIRKLDPAGNVSTVAGSGALLVAGLGVAGGFRNGAAHEARFDRPLGLAVAADGTIYVADAKNHCVRKIVGGLVSTLAGSPDRAGGADGPRETATFNDPRSVAVDSGGTLYVADYPNGLRIISPAGNVTTVHTDEPIVSVSIGRFAPRFFSTAGDVLLASSVSAIYVYDVAKMTIALTLQMDGDFKTGNPSEGLMHGGPPISAVAYDDSAIVTADPLFRTVRYVGLPVEALYFRALGAEPLENAATFSGALRDGPGEFASFVSPMAVARSPFGRVVVADAGAKRIRMLGPFDERNEERNLALGELPTVRRPHEYRIALVGSSYVDMAQPWSSSMPGVIENALRAGDPTTTKDVRVYPIRREALAPLAALSIVSDYLATGVVDAIVLDLPTTQGASLPDVEKKLVEVKAELGNERIPFYVVYRPEAGDMLGETSYVYIPRTYKGDSEVENDLSERDPGDVQTNYDATRKMLDAAHVATIDQWPDFIAHHRAADATPLFGALDHHLTAIGNVLAGRSIAHRLLLERPWK